MIERLMNLEQPCRESEYYNLLEQIILLKKRLYDQLNQQGKDQLEELTDIYTAQLSTLREAAFIDGFCSSVNLMMDYLEHRIINCPKANQEQPPES
jgi:hypothetical protein